MSLKVKQKHREVTKWIINVLEVIGIFLCIKLFFKAWFLELGAAIVFFVLLEILKHNIIPVESTDTETKK